MQTFHQLQRHDEVESSVQLCYRSVFSLLCHSNVGSEEEDRLPWGIQSRHADDEHLPPRNKGKQRSWASDASQGCPEGSSLTLNCITQPGRWAQLFPFVLPATSVLGWPISSFWINLNKLLDQPNIWTLVLVTNYKGRIWLVSRQDSSLWMSCKRKRVILWALRNHHVVQRMPHQLANGTL